MYVCMYVCMCALTFASSAVHEVLSCMNKVCGENKHTYKKRARKNDGD